MDRPTPLGMAAIMIYSDNADTLAEWYQQHVGLFFSREPESHRWWCELPRGLTFAISQSRHPRGKGWRSCEITLDVADLDTFVEHLADLGVSMDERQDTAIGAFAWLNDPDGNRIALRQRREG